MKKTFTLRLTEEQHKELLERANGQSLQSFIVGELFDEEPKEDPKPTPPKPPKGGKPKLTVVPGMKVRGLEALRLIHSKPALDFKHRKTPYFQAEGWLWIASKSTNGTYWIFEAVQELPAFLWAIFEDHIYSFGYESRTTQDLLRKSLEWLEKLAPVMLPRHLESTVSLYAKGHYGDKDMQEILQEETEAKSLKAA